MPSKDDHLEKARHNEEFYGGLTTHLAGYRDWQVTSVFYAAVHYVDAYLATRNEHPTRHERRDWWVSNEASLRRIGTDYAELKDRSIDARYDLISFPSTFPQAKYNNELARIRAHVESIL